MLVKGDSVAQQGLITASLVLLVDLTVLKELNLVLHEDHLLLHIQDILFLEVLGQLVACLSLGLLLLHLVRALQVRVPFVLFVSDACLLLIFVRVGPCKKVSLS